MNQTTKDLIIENARLHQQLIRLKLAIKTCESTFILDGKDISDWGWMTIENVNLACLERWGVGISEYK